MFIDTHSHLNTSKQGFYFYNGLSLDTLIASYPQECKTIICLNPKISEFSCPNDCTKNCHYYGTNSNVEKCTKGCKYENIHTVSTFDGNNGEIILKCTKCGHIVYVGKDPLRRYNIELLQQVSKYPNLYPMIYLNISNETICDEIQFYESNYPIVGYKLHPQTNYRSVDELINVPTTLPILIHTGLSTYDHPKNAINFAKRHKGPIILAHAARLDVECLKAVNELQNLYLDVCPSNLLFNSKDFALAAPLREKVNCPQDIYNLVLKYVSVDKILFGSDYAWGIPNEELSVVESLPISLVDKEKILYKNALRLYNLN